MGSGRRPADLIQERYRDKGMQLLSPTLPREAHERGDSPFFLAPYLGPELNAQNHMHIY